MAGVGTAKVFENEKVAIWELALEPGEKTGVHTHRHDYVFYVLEGSRLETYDEKEAPLFEFDASAGEVFVLRCEGAELVAGEGAESFRVPATHGARNVGPTRYREILVETKRSA
jgi:hypothetical protein